MLDRRTKVAISHATRVKIYPGGFVDIMACSRRVFVESGWEPVEDSAACLAVVKASDGLRRDVARPVKQSEVTASSSAARRARTAIRDIALCNRFHWFVTLTLNQDKVDRYDMAQVTRKLNQWLNNQVKRRGLRYVLVPERHKDGAIHFHGLVNDVLSAIDSGTISPPEGGKPRKPRSEAQRQTWLDAGGHVVYNLPQWSLGYTTAIALYGDYHAAIGYVCKYVGKQGDKPGGRWYYSGGQLARPKVLLLDDLSMDDVMRLPGSYVRTVQAAHFAYASWRGELTDCNAQHIIQSYLDKH